ncbi:hypothetical protein HD554DRAFT_1770130 [Boletus coccyginus]|nr:hypothetical protein HD554DRAFT_1770130 [Boletus coccyginus]
MNSNRDGHTRHTRRGRPPGPWWRCYDSLVAPHYLGSLEPNRGGARPQLQCLRPPSALFVTHIHQNILRVQLALSPIDPKVSYTVDRSHRMPIITPADPAMCSHSYHDVTASAQVIRTVVLREHFSRTARIVIERERVRPIILRSTNVRIGRRGTPSLGGSCDRGRAVRKE